MTSIISESIAKESRAPVSRHEKVHTVVTDDSAEAVEIIAEEIATLIKSRQAEGLNCVLGLATGSSPVGLYNRLVRMHQEDGLSFQNVVTFNLDEYYPMSPREAQSYHRFMHEYLFDHIDIPAENVHIPDGTLEQEKVREYCQEYERKIEALGGIDIQLLGIGRTGHIGFNEPGSGEKSRTRLIRLDRITRLDAASDFYGEEFVPPLAITMGVGTIMEARKIFLVAWGEGKAPIVAQTVQGPIDTTVPATFLQLHPNCEFVLDTASASELTRIKSPWELFPVDWSEPKMIKKAVIWLALKLNKVVLKLTNEDYNEHGMSSLIAERGTARRSEEHTSELQSPDHLVCRLLLEKKKEQKKKNTKNVPIIRQPTDTTGINRNNAHRSLCAQSTR